MSRPPAFIGLRRPCRRCGRELVPRYFRGRNKTCSPCLDGTRYPTASENIVIVSRELFERLQPTRRRYKWPDYVIFEK